MFVLIGLFIGPALWRVALEVLSSQFFYLPPLYLVDLQPSWSPSALKAVPNLICMIVGLAVAAVRYRSAEPFVFSGIKLFMFLLGCLAGVFNFFHGLFA